LFQCRRQSETIDCLTAADPAGILPFYSPLLKDTERKALRMAAK
jgi:hypothetical protein